MDLITGTEYENLAPSTSLSPLDMVKLLTEHSRKSIKENNTFEREFTNDKIQIERDLTNDKIKIVINQLSEVTHKVSGSKQLH